MPEGVLIEAVAGEAGVAGLRARPGDVLFRPGDPCRGFVALKRGVIKVTMTSPAGREIVLYRVHPGEICLQTFACLVQQNVYGAEGVVETEAEGVLISAPAFERLMGADTSFRAAVMNSIAERFADFEQVVEALAFTGLEQRLAAALLRLADAADLVHATHEALAAEIGSAREAVSRQLAVFAKQRLVTLARGRVALLRREALARLAQTPL